MIRNVAFDLVIVDLHFKLHLEEAFLGIPLIKEIRIENPNLPMIAITGYENQPNIEKDSKEAGANEFLGKSEFSPKRWRKVLKELIQKKG